MYYDEHKRILIDSTTGAIIPVLDGDDIPKNIFYIERNVNEHSVSINTDIDDFRGNAEKKESHLTPDLDEKYTYDTKDSEQHTANNTHNNLTTVSNTTISSIPDIKMEGPKPYEYILWFHRVWGLPQMTRIVPLDG